MPGLVGETPAAAPAAPEEPVEPEVVEEVPKEELIAEKAKQAVEEARFHANDAAQLAEQVPEASSLADEAVTAADEAQEAYAAVEEAKAELDAADPEDLNAMAAGSAMLEEAAAPVFDALRRAMAACEEIRNTLIPQSKTAEPGLGAELAEWAAQTIQGGGD
jgi:hypothetical protein